MGVGVRPTTTTYLRAMRCGKQTRSREAGYRAYRQIRRFPSVGGSRGSVRPSLTFYDL